MERDISREDERFSGSVVEEDAMKLLYFNSRGAAVSKDLCKGETAARVFAAIGMFSCDGCDEFHFAGPVGGCRESGGCEQY